MTNEIPNTTTRYPWQIAEGREGRPQEFRIGSLASVLDGEPACVLGVQADPHSDGVVYRVEECLHWLDAALLLASPTPSGRAPSE